MVEVNRNYKLINLEIDGEERTEEIDTKEAWSVMEVVVDGKPVTVHEGNQIEFVTENGESVQCVVNKMTGNGTKIKLQVKRFASECEEIWAVASMVKIKVIEVDGSKKEDEEDNR